MKQTKAQSIKPAGASTLHDVIDDLRQKPQRLSIPIIIAASAERGITITWNSLREIAELGHGEVAITPKFITDFIGAYAAELRPKSILDPWASVGSMLGPIVAQCEGATGTGIVRSEDEAAVARTISAGKPIDWVQADPRELLRSLGEYDLIVSSPPWGLGPQTITINQNDATVQVRDSGTYTLILEGALHLTSDGVAAFLLPNGFFFQKAKNGVREAMEKCGLFVNSVIALPAGTFSPYTAIPLNIVLISRKKTPDFFIGQLTPATDHKPLLNNLRKRMSGASIELGRLVKSDEFRSWQQMVASEEEQRLAKRSGLQAIRLKDVVSAINLGKQTEDGDFENLQNCVYLPLIGTSPAAASLSDLRIKPQNYAQLVVRSEVAHAEFLAGFFNSPLGRKTRESMLSGTYIPKLSKQTIAEGTVYVLPLDAQRQATAVGREIHDLRLRLEQLERDLWSRPVDSAIVRKTMNNLNQKEGIESWLETLPFPLASILWRYQAAGNAEHKVTHLLNSFEALAQFHGMLMASAFYSNKVFFREHRNDWFERGKDNPHSLARSSFGEWVIRCQRLAKTTRQMLSDKEQRTLILDLYRTDAEKIETLANKGIYAVLETVGQFRNDWKGHTGIVGAKENERRLSVLQEELTRVRGLLGGVFEDWWLIRPDVSSYIGGVHHYAVEKLVGTRQIFKQETLDTTEVMDASELYCFDVATRRPLQLLHFVRMLSAPESEEAACYFYNRLEKNSVRWVSYHFEKAAERVEPDSAVFKLINEVEGDGPA